MHLTEYETTLVIRPDVGGDAVETTLDKVRDVVKVGGGKLIAIDHWGKKKLAYDIQKHSRGIYVHTHFLGGQNLVLELERNLRIQDNVLRFLTVRLAADVAVDSVEEKAYVKPQYEADDGSAVDEGPTFGVDDDADQEGDEGGMDERPRRGGRDEEN